MAVVQISKIQLRRGRKNTGTGMPQLASGELAWAIDTQELYIGNGAVGEGSPAVGNTKVLTEKDSILELASTYQYKYDSSLGQSTLEGTVSRTLQSRLDDGVVNVRSFNIKNLAELLVGEDPDQSSKIQTALDELAGSDPVTLEFNPGTYQIESTITLPSNVKISGFGKNVTIFNSTSAGLVFDTVTDVTRLKLKDFSVRITANESTCLRLNNAIKNEFENIRFVYNNGSSTSTATADARIGIQLLNNSGLISDNKFTGIEFNSLTYAVTDFSTLQGVGTVSLNKFDSCLLEYMYQGFNLGNSTGGASYNIITNSIFDQVLKEGVVVNVGTGNRSKTNTYRNVGTDNTGTTSSTGVIKFTGAGNTSTNDTFDRSSTLEPPNIATFVYKPVVEGTGSYSVGPNKLSLTDDSGTFKNAFRLPLNGATSYKVDYVLRSTLGSYMKKGTFHISTDQANPFIIQFVDEYEYAGSNPVYEAATVFEGAVAGTTTPYIVIKYKNIIDNDVINFTYTYTQLS